MPKNWNNKTEIYPIKNVALVVFFKRYFKDFSFLIENFKFCRISLASLFTRKFISWTNDLCDLLENGF